ncbi:MAG: glycoside hydrolase family 9 protein [Chloroflexota bacterium]
MPRYRCLCIAVFCCALILAGGCSLSPGGASEATPPVPTAVSHVDSTPTAPLATAEAFPAPTSTTVAGVNVPSPTVTPIAASDVAIRVNQIGYLPDEEKHSLVLSRLNLSGRPFHVVSDIDGSVVITGSVDVDRGPYGLYPHLYDLDFSSLTASGTYHVALAGLVSPPFNVGMDTYSALVAKSLQFFRVQGCGDTGALEHDVCHMLDGVARGAPMDGKRIDADGGWHDAGDYLKFMHTTGASTVMMLAAFERHPSAFASTNNGGTPDVLSEARVGLDWMYKMWDPVHEVLYYQVGDVSDHDGWRLPEDDNNLPLRPVWASEPGKGANLAGKAAASFALAATLWGDESQTYYDADLAKKYLKAAIQLYDFGVANPEAQSSTDGFYNEVSWQDDMALAAIELYRATGDGDYLSAARHYIEKAGTPYNLTWSELHALAYYEIARADASYVDVALAYLENDLQAYERSARANTFQVGLDEMFWGSSPVMMGITLEELFYEDLGGAVTYRAVGQAQRDYLLGTNPWGVCMVNSAGTTWPRHPHNQIADLKQIELVGAWGPGPDKLSNWREQKIDLAATDIYAEFQSPFAVYHDDTADYVTNESAIVPNAWGVMLSSWYGR